MTERVDNISIKDVVEKALSVLRSAIEDMKVGADKIFDRPCFAHVPGDAKTRSDDDARSILLRLMDEGVVLEPIAQLLGMSVRSIRNFANSTAPASKKATKAHRLANFLFHLDGLHATVAKIEQAKQTEGGRVDRMPRVSRAPRVNDQYEADWLVYIEHAIRCRYFPKSYVCPFSIASDELAKLCWLVAQAKTYLGTDNERRIGYLMRMLTNFYYALGSAIDREQAVECDRERLLYYYTRITALQATADNTKGSEDPDVVQKNTNIYGYVLLHLGILLDSKVDRAEATDVITSNIGVDYDGRDVHAANIWTGHHSLALRHPDEAEQFLENVMENATNQGPLTDLATALNRIGSEQTRCMLRKPKFEKLATGLRNAGAKLSIAMMMAASCGIGAQLIEGVGCGAV